MSMLKTYSHTFSLSLSLTLTLSHSHTLSISHSITLDMLNKFCFHLYAQNSLFIGENCNGFFLVFFLVDTNESEETGSTRALAYSLAGERPRHFAAENRNIFRPYTGPCSHLEQNNGNTDNN